MPRSRPTSTICIAMLVAGLCSTSAFAQFSIPSFCIDSGGNQIASVSFSLSSTIAQPEGGYLIGSRFSIQGGYLGSRRTTPRCPADLDDGSGTGTPDGGVTIEDLLYYLAIYEAGVPAADVDDGSGTGTRDGGVTIEDLLYFLTRYQAGC